MYKDLQNIIQDEIRKSRGSSIERRRTGRLDVAASAWISDANIGGKIGKALAIVLNTIGCGYARGSAGGCAMCSYLLDGTSGNPDVADINAQFDGAYKKIENENGPIVVKMYTSGSFLDVEEVPLAAREYILERIGDDERVTSVVIESRPEYVTDDSMEDIRRTLGERRIEIGIGLESSSDRIRNLCINKGFTLQDFQRAVETASKHEIGVRSYVLMKPLFLTERDSIVDSTKTILDAIDMGVSTVSVNPVNVQKRTLVEYLWRRREYRPPWLWSVVHVLKESHMKSNDSVPIVCDPVAVGKERGAHNCGKCDGSFGKAIRSFSLHQQPDVFDSLACDCKNQWEHVLKHEDASGLVHATRMQS